MVNLGRLLAIFLSVSSMCQLAYSQLQLGTEIPGTGPAWNHYGFGYSVDMDASGERIVVGHPAYDGGTGRVQIYDWNGSTWNQVGSDITGSNIEDRFGVDVAINSDGNRLVVGAPMNLSNTGYAAVYEWSGNDWVMLGSALTGDAFGDETGWSVAMNSTGDQIAFSSPSYDRDAGISGVNVGKVQVAEWDGMDWVSKGEALLGDLNLKSFGLNLALSASGDRLIASAPFNNAYVKVFDWDGQEWDQMGQKLTGNNGGDWLGQGLDISADGNRIALGVPKVNIGSETYAKVMDWNGSSWVQSGSILEGPDDTNAAFGYAVALTPNGSRLAIGNYTYSFGLGLEGRIYSYDFSGADWESNGFNYFGSDFSDQLGWSVAYSADGSRLVTGAPFADNLIGFVRVYQTAAVTSKEPKPNCVKISPNPTTGRLHFPPGFTGKFKLINMQGKILMQGQVDYGWIDITSCPSGTYYIQVEDENLSIQQLIVKC